MKKQIDEMRLLTIWEVLVIIIISTVMVGIAVTYTRVELPVVDQILGHVELEDTVYEFVYPDWANGYGVTSHGVILYFDTVDISGYPPNRCQYCGEYMVGLEELCDKLEDYGGNNIEDK